MIIYMAKVNCRHRNICVFCKNWLGPKPETDFLTGDSKIKIERGLCSLDTVDQYHKSTDLCHKFQKDILYT